MFWVLVVLFLAILFIVVPAVVTSLIYRRIPVDKNKRRFLQGAALYPAAMDIITNAGSRSSAITMLSFQRLRSWLA